MVKGLNSKLVFHNKIIHVHSIEFVSKFKNSTVFNCIIQLITNLHYAFCYTRSIFSDFKRSAVKASKNYWYFTTSCFHCITHFCCYTCERSHILLRIRCAQYFLFIVKSSRGNEDLFLVSQPFFRFPRVEQRSDRKWWKSFKVAIFSTLFEEKTNKLMSDD